MATKSELNVLCRLSDSELDIADPAQDVRGREVRDASGEKIGKVIDLFVDETERRVRMIEVASGGFLGMGRDKLLIPIDAIQSVTDESVYINRNSVHLAGAPAYHPQLISDDMINRTYAYYGYRPYWQQGYTYPARWCI